MVDQAYTSLPVISWPPGTRAVPPSIWSAT